MSSFEFDLMDELYFPASFDELVERLSREKKIIYETLTSLLQQEFIVQLQFNSKTKDFDKLENPDFSSIEKSSFVATKQGLTAHTGVQ